MKWTAVAIYMLCYPFYVVVMALFMPGPVSVLIGSVLGVIFGILLLLLLSRPSEQNQRRRPVQQPAQQQAAAPQQQRPRSFVPAQPEPQQQQKFQL